MEQSHLNADDHHQREDLADIVVLSAHHQVPFQLIWVDHKMNGRTEGCHQATLLPGVCCFFSPSFVPQTLNVLCGSFKMNAPKQEGAQEQTLIVFRCKMVQSGSP